MTQWTAARWEHISAHLDQALELQGTERERWLENLEAQDPELGRELRTVLEAHDTNEAAAFLESSPLAQGTVLPGNEANAEDLRLVGKQFGPYRVLSLLGHGGMGSVWLADRVDGLFSRKVALKLVHLSLTGQTITKRFSREREILAGLSHPNIARLFDAGVSQDGQPYLALEYVAGETLTIYCENHSLAVRERLELFLQVLSAVQYAHARLIIHRDLKPSNILVTAAGQVQLLDFGIAKLLIDGEAKETELTQLGGRALTPEYAAPEQISGTAITVAADIYALGVILYELLTGARPYRLKRDSRGALEDAILQGETTPPSNIVISEHAAQVRSTSPEKLARALKGDLDAIVVKALKKLPSERYQTAEALHDDIGRHLRGEVVLAPPDSVAYRAVRFVRRCWMDLTTGSGLSMGAALVAAVIIMSVFAMRSGWIAHRGEKSVAVLPFVDMSEAHDQEYFSDGLAEDLIDLLVKVQGLRVTARTSSFYFKGKQTTIAKIASELRVAHVIEGSVRIAGNHVRITVQLVQADTGYQIWSETYDRRLDDIFRIQDEIAKAVVEALKISLLGKALPAVIGTSSPDVYELYLQARALMVGHRPADVETAAQLLRHALQIDPKYAPAWALYAKTRTMLLETNVIPYSRARDEALDAATRAIAADPNLGATHMAMVRFHMFFDWDWNAAGSELAIARRLDPFDADTIRYAGSLAWSLGRDDEALSLFQIAAEYDPLDGANDFLLGRLNLTLGRLAVARAALQRSVALAPSLGGHFALGNVLRMSGEPAAALKEYELAESEDDRLVGRALTLKALGREAEGDAALASLEASFGDADAYEIAGIYASRGNPDKAFAWLARAYDQHDQSLTLLKHDPMLRSIAGDLRYRALLRKMNMPE